MQGTGAAGRTRRFAWTSHPAGVSWSHGRSGAGDSSRRDRPPHCQGDVPMKRLIALLMLALFTAGTLTACNTVRGAGQDVQKVGEKMEETAEDTGGTTDGR